MAFTPLALGADRTELLIREGVELRKQGNNAEAVSRFTKAYEQSHTPRAAAQLGLCEQALERWIDAELHLSEALAGASDPWVAKNRKVLSETLVKTRSRLALLVIEGAAAAQVHVNGEYVGNLPTRQNVRVLPGGTTVTATAAGFITFEEKFVAQAGKDALVVVVMTKESASIVTTPLPVEPADTALPTEAVTRQGLPSSTGPSRTWLWVGGAVAIAAVAGIVVLASSGSSYPRTDATRDFPAQ